MSAILGGILFTVIALVAAGALVYTLGFVISAFVSFAIALTKSRGGGRRRPESAGTAVRQLRRPALHHR